MRGDHLRTVALLVVVTAAATGGVVLHDHLPTVEQLRAHKEELLELINAHYLLAVGSFIGLYLTTALFLPGALVLSVAGGLMFGTLPAAAYLNLAATSGAVLAFLTARFLLRDRIQGRFEEQLRRFNAEMERHGPHYLLVLRMLPVLPFFVVNYCAGISRIPLKTFVWTTSLGIIPGSLIHAYIGSELRRFNAPHDLFSGRILAALALISLAALIPVLRYHLPRRKRR